MKIEAIGVNYTDIYQRSGQYPGQLPATIGQEAAGVVEAIGPGVTNVQVGQRVAYTSQPGAYADFAVIKASALVPIPDGVDTRTAAAVMLQGMTAHYLAVSTYPLKNEELLWRSGELFRWIKDGELKVRIDTTFPLSAAAEAHRYMEGRKTRGKVLLIP